MNSSVEKEAFSGTTLADKSVHKVLSKDIYDTPYQFSWLPLKSDVGQAIIGRLSLALRDYPRRRRTRGKRSTRIGGFEAREKVHGGKKKRREMQKRELEVNDLSGGDAVADNSNTLSELREVRSLDKVNASHFDQVVLGLNAITRALESDLLRLVIVCQNVQPRRLIEHLPVLCKIRKVVFCLLSESSKSLAQLFSNSLDIRSLMCIGFKRVTEMGYWDEMVEFIERQTPPLNIPWLQSSVFESSSSSGQGVPYEDQVKTVLHRDGRQSTSSEIGEALAPVLQPLNIKRAIYAVDPSRTKRAKIKEIS